MKPNGPRTLEGFLRALKKSGKRWRLDRNKRIRYRSHHGCPCPLTAVYGCYIDTPLGDAENSVIATADNFAAVDAALRRRLLRACGLKEER